MNRRFDGNKACFHSVPATALTPTGTGAIGELSVHQLCEPRLPAIHLTEDSCEPKMLDEVEQSGLTENKYTLCELHKGRSQDVQLDLTCLICFRWFVLAPNGSRLGWLCRNIHLAVSIIRHLAWSPSRTPRADSFFLPSSLLPSKSLPLKCLSVREKRNPLTTD